MIMMHHQTGCKRLSSLVDLVETVLRCFYDPYKVLTLKLANQSLQMTLHFMMMHCYAHVFVRSLDKYTLQKLMLADLFTLDLEHSNPVFAHDTLAYNDVSPYWVWLQMVQ